MRYRSDRYGNDISVLGYGCMRFSQRAGRIDVAKAGEEVMAAIEAGVNYFDTAYIYPGSEAALGQVLEQRGVRERVHVATKLPHYLIKSARKAEELFQEQLRRLRTTYVDYYLMHMLTDVGTWERLCGLGIDAWLAQKVAAGQIRQVGFSYHGNSEMFCRLLDVRDWDFCQIQYNYLDEHSQAGRTGLRHAASKGVPVIVMEPLRGGRLVTNLPRRALELMEGHEPRRTPAAWALAWLWNQPEVTCVLSGMNSRAMVDENVACADASAPGCLNAADEALLAEVVRAINANTKVGCTGCRYCMPCPRGVDIPGTFAAYNRLCTDGRFTALKEYVMCTLMRRDVTAASLCVGCGACERRCPQGIAIREELAGAVRELEGPAFKVARKVLPLVARY